MNIDNQKLEVINVVNQNQTTEILSKQSKERNYTLDFIRTIAIIFVVLCHIIEMTVLYVNGGLFFRIASYLLFSISRLGVPLFLFLTGFLCLSKVIETDEDVFKFYKHNLIPLVLKTMGWIVIYHLFLTIYFDFNISVKIFIKNILFIWQQPHMIHMWYMPMIIGVYVFIPFIAKIVKSFSFKSLIIPLAIVMFITSFVPLFNRCFDKNIGFLFDIRFTAGIYGVYIIFGYFIKNSEKLKKIPNYILLLLFLLFLGLTVFEQVYLQKVGRSYGVWYDDTFLFFASVFLFVWLKNINIKKSKFSNFLKFTSKNSLLVFFMHMIVLYIFKDYLFKYFNNLFIRLFICFILTLIICYVIAYIINLFMMVIKNYIIPKIKEKFKNAKA